MKNVSDPELVTLFQSGNSNAFGEIVGRHWNPVIAAIIKKGVDTETAQDISQETFLQAMKTIQAGKYTECKKLRPWLTRIAVNLAVDYHRKQKRNPIKVERGIETGEANELHFDNHMFTLLAIAQSDISNPDISTIWKIDYEERLSEELQAVTQIINQLLETLPEDQKNILILRYLQNMSFKEIATRENIPLNTALGRVRYALINLRKTLENSKQNITDVLRITTGINVVA